MHHVILWSFSTNYNFTLTSLHLCLEDVVPCPFLASFDSAYYLIQFPSLDLSESVFSRKMHMEDLNPVFLLNTYTCHDVQAILNYSLYSILLH